jgi:flagellar basal-body rod protein FlgC
LSNLSISTALSGMMASAQRLNASASNVANSQSRGPIPSTPPTQPVAQRPSGEPQVYNPVRAVQKSAGGSNWPDGTLASLQPVTPSYVPEYDPTSSYADKEGMVAAPNVDPVQETVQQIQAVDTYRLNARVMEAGDDMLKTVLDVKA